MEKKIRVMMVDDEPLIRKVVKMEMNGRAASVESGDLDASVISRVEMVDTFADGPSLTAALSKCEAPDYLLVDMELDGEPTGGLRITSRVHERYPDVKIIIFSGRFDAPLPGEDDRVRRLYDIGRVVMDALQLGASAFVSKNAVGGFAIENVLRAIACLERGEQFYFNYPVMLTLKEAAGCYLDLVAEHDPTFGLSDTEHRLLLLEAAGCTAAEISNQLGETDKVIQERQKDLSRRLDIVNKSAARVAKAISLGLISPADVRFLPRG
jgi:DNA-binding NarL/FixJ family response regulator